jgi:hypothetical protein
LFNSHYWMADSNSAVMLVYRFSRLCFRLRAALLCRFSLSFTTCFGLHGHLQVCSIFYFHMLGGFCFAAFFYLFSHVVTLCMFPFVFFSCFPSLFLLFPCVFLCLLFLCCLFVQQDAKI